MTFEGHIKRRRGESQLADRVVNKKKQKVKKLNELGKKVFHESVGLVFSAFCS